jgi:P-type Cu2+ transporter
VPRPGALVLTLAGLGLTFLGGGLPRTLALAATSLGALPALRRAVRTLVAERRLAPAQLDAAVLAMMLLSGDVRGAALTRLLVALGEEIRERTARRERRAMLDLERTLGRSAWLVLGTEEVAVPVERLQVGDLVAVHEWEQVPVDGLVEEGTASLDQRALTGEGRTVHREPGDTVLAASVVLQGQLRVRATAVGAHTRAGWVVRTLQHAPTHDTRVGTYTEHLADRLVLPTLALAGLSYAATRELARAEAILIVDYSTGVELSAPASVLATTTSAARDGVLIKSGRALERLAAADAVVLDKTGTLTRGWPRIAEVVSVDPRWTADEVLGLAAGAEHGVRHLLARTIVRYSERQGVAIPDAEETKHLPRLGMRAEIWGQTVWVGGVRLLEEAGIPLAPGQAEAERLIEAGHSLISVAVNDALVGLIAYHDPPRAESAAVVAWLLAHGMREVHLVTGDAPPAAYALARQVGIEHVHAGALPDDKAAVVRDLQRRGHVVVMVGEGLDDVAALVQADVAVALSLAEDAVRETADVILMTLDLMGLARAIEWARQCRRLIRENLLLVAVPNVLAVLLAASGRLSPVGARLLSDSSTLLAAGNSLRPLLARGPGAMPRAPRP